MHWEGSLQSVFNWDGVLWGVFSARLRKAPDRVSPGDQNLSRLQTQAQFV